MDMLEKITTILENKKAMDIKTVEVKEKTTLTDYFVIVSGTSNTHVKALADNVEYELKKRTNSTEQSRRLSNWNLDFNGLWKSYYSYLYSRRKGKIQFRRLMGKSKKYGIKNRGQRKIFAPFSIFFLIFSSLSFLLYMPITQGQIE